MATATQIALREPIELQSTVQLFPNASDDPTPRREEEDRASRLQRLGMGEEQEDDGLPPRDGGRKAWQFIAAACVLETFVWGYVTSFSPVLVWFQAHEPWRRNSLTALSAVPTIQLALQYFLPLFFVNFFRRYPEYLKPVLLGSALLYSLSMLAASWSTKIWHLILLQGVLCGITGSILYTPVVMHLNAWFVERRGLAGGIIFAGTGIGGATFPFLISKLLDTSGFSGMCRIWAGIAGVTTIGSVLFLQPRSPPVKPKGKREKWFLLDLDILKSPTFWIMFASTFFASLSYFPVSLYLATFASSVLKSPNLLLPSVVVSVFNASAFLGSTVIGAAADRSVDFTIFALGISRTSSALCGSGMSHSLAGVTVFSVLYGFGSRITAYFGPGAKLIAGSNPHASTTILCFFSIGRGIATLAGPFISSALYQENKKDSDTAEWGRYGFEGIIIFVGLMSLLSAAGGVILRFVRKAGIK
ncbi:uncharacterized protein JCM6883_001749 [Sporobolomyces salmoneus]|uniref:uncharacterized protein n=1 Tax=Sporobolomyces salmoneus TaxID=183962 RepID=UPI0031762243